MFDAEHFFDGFKSNPKYALECLKTAYNRELDGLSFVTPMEVLFPTK